MNGKIQRVNKNIRYRIISINGNQYILDMEKSFWKNLFPFAYWLLPHTVFKIDNENIVEKLKSPSVKQTKTGYFSAFGAGVSLILANLLGPLMHYFNIQMSPLLNSFIIFVFIALVILFRLYLNKINQNNLYKVVMLNQLKTDKLWAKPKSIRYILVFLFYYLFLLAFIVLGIGAFIEEGNVMMLLISMFLLLFVLLGSGITVTTEYTKVESGKNSLMNNHEKNRHIDGG